MGLISSSVRLIYLNSYRHDLENRMLKINYEKLRLVANINELINVGSDLSPDSPEMKKLEKRRERLELIEKRLDEQMQRYQIQLKMVEGEYQSCQQIVDKNIQRSYS